MKAAVAHPSLNSLNCATPRGTRGGVRGSRQHTRASNDPPSSQRATTRGDDVETVRYGLGRGSTAFYPRVAEQSPQATSPLPRRSTDPSTTYEDGAMDKLAILLFNFKLEQAVNAMAVRRDNSEGASSSSSALPPSGFSRLVALADRIAVRSSSPAEQRQVVLATLLGLIPAPVRTLFKIFFKPAPWVDRMNAVITVEAFAWLVGWGVGVWGLGLRN